MCLTETHKVLKCHAVSNRTAIQRKTIVVRVETVKLLEVVAHAIEGIAPLDRKLERSSTRYRISIAEMAENAIRLGAQQLCEQNDIKYPG